MQTGTAAWLVILVALAGANLPFLNQRLFALIPVVKTAGKKPFWLRLLELGVLYGLTGLLGIQLEANIGNVFTQGWEFYAVSGCLFLVLAFPGFVFQYLRRP